MRMKVLKDADSEIVLGSPSSERLLERLGAASLVFLCLCCSLVGLSSTNWEYVESVLDVAMLLFGGCLISSIMLGLAAGLWALGNVFVRLQFNCPPGFITVTHSPSWGGFWFMNRTVQIPLEEMRRIYSSTDYALLQTGPISATTTTVYRVSVPNGKGETIVVYRGNDPETARLVERRIRDAIGMTPQ